MKLADKLGLPHCVRFISITQLIITILICLSDGKLDFDSFVSIASNFLEEEDDEAMQQELKEAFRLYDKGGCVLTFP